MQNPKSRSSSSEAPHKISPKARSPKLNPLELSSESAGPGNRTPKDGSSKVSDRRSPRSPVCERKRSSRVSELESQISQLQDELKKVKDQLITSESSKNSAQENEEEVKNELLLVSSKLEESQNQLSELANSKEAHIAELRNIVDEKNEAWKSQLEAVQKQHAADAASLASARDEIEKLKLHLEMVAESDNAQRKSKETTEAELDSLREKLEETFTLLEITKNELVSCKESEAQAKETVNEVLPQLEAAKETIDALRLDAIKATEAYNCIISELDHSRAHGSSLESLVKKLEAELTKISLDEAANAANEHISVDSVVEIQNILNNNLETELNDAKCEVARLKSALEAAEIKCHEDSSRSTVQVTSAQELVEQIKSASSLRHTELDEELKKAHTDIEELRANLMNKETEFQDISGQNKRLEMKLEESASQIESDNELEKELKKLRGEVAELHAKLIEQESELQNTLQQKEILKTEAKKREVHTAARNDALVAEVETSLAAEQELMAKLSQVMEEADKSSKKVTRVCEQLEAAQAVNAEMESELRKLKVQSDQWRKAAEAAASMLSIGSNGKYVERTRSLDTNFSPIPGRISSGYLNEFEVDSPKKKNGSVLKKIGILWRKPQKG
ncbi:hypothetical protein Droror1_Dr00019518 [Drosera rotundifolia]